MFIAKAVLLMIMCFFYDVLKKPGIAIAKRYGRQVSFSVKNMYAINRTAVFSNECAAGVNFTYGCQSRNE